MRRLSIFRPHPLIINDIMSNIKNEYQSFAEKHKALSKGDYQTYLRECTKEIDSLEKAGVAIRDASIQVVGQLNAVQHKLEDFRDNKLKQHKHAKQLIRHINHLLNAIKQIEERIRRHIGIAMRQEAVVSDFTKK